MWLTFGEKFTGSCWTSPMLVLVVVLSTFASAPVSGWEHDEPTGTLLEGNKCRVRSGEPGICTRIEACVAYADGLRKKTIQYNSLVRCSFVGITEIICCPAAPTPTTATPESTTVGTVINRSENERPSQAACRQYNSANPAQLTFHILDGVPVNPGDYPHMGGLIYNSSGGGNDVELRCGSSLISERYVLTAAHCVYDPLAPPTMVRFGVVIWNSVEDGNVPVDVEVESIILHPEYVSPSRYHDIALIRLARPVQFTPFVRPSCLHADMADLDSSIPLVVIGWGVTDVSTRARSDVLLMTNVTTVPLLECNATHISYGVSRHNRNGLNEGQYCAFDKELKKDSCNADSGGPLQWVRGKEMEIVGIVSFGNSCGTAIPSVYARVAYYLSWIESVVWPTNNTS